MSGIAKLNPSATAQPKAPLNDKKDSKSAALTAIATAYIKGGNLRAAIEVADAIAAPAGTSTLVTFRTLLDGLTNKERLALLQLKKPSTFRTLLNGLTNDQRLALLQLQNG